MQVNSLQTNEGPVHGTHDFVDKNQGKLGPFKSEKDDLTATNQHPNSKEINEDEKTHQQPSNTNLETQLPSESSQTDLSLNATIKEKSKTKKKSAKRLTFAKDEILSRVRKTLQPQQHQNNSNNAGKLLPSVVEADAATLSR